MISKENQLLINKSLSGNRLAQGDIYRKYVKAMYHIAVRMVSQPAIAKDLTQDVFVKVFEELGQFRGASTLGAWIKRITINTCLNHLRREGLLKKEQWNDSLIEVAEEPNDLIDTVDMKIIHEAIKALPTGSRTVLTLYLLEGYRHNEIAEILDISLSTSKTQYRRGKQLLKERLKSIYNED